MTIESTTTPQLRGLFALGAAQMEQQAQEPIVSDKPEDVRRQLGSAWLLYESLRGRASVDKVAAALAGISPAEHEELREAYDLSLSLIGNRCKTIGVMPFGIGGYGEENTTVH